MVGNLIVLSGLGDHRGIYSYDLLVEILIAVTLCNIEILDGMV